MTYTLTHTLPSSLCNSIHTHTHTHTHTIDYGTNVPQGTVEVPLLLVVAPEIVKGHRTQPEPRRLIGDPSAALGEDLTLF